MVLATNVSRLSAGAAEVRLDSSKTGAFCPEIETFASLAHLKSLARAAS